MGFFSEIKITHRLAVKIVEFILFQFYGFFRVFVAIFFFSELTLQMNLL